MPRHDISSVYIADGFVEDCEVLMQKCSKFARLNYEKFCDIWKEMQFVRVFHGKKLSAEIAEMSEEVLFVAKNFMLNKNSGVEESVAGLFLVYALQNLQPYSGFASLRIVPEDVPLIENLAKAAREQRRCDVLYILGCVLIKGPVHYHAAARERGMELSYRKYLEGTGCTKEISVRRKGVFYRHSDEMDIIKDYHTISRLYSETKAEISGSKKFDRGLSYVSDNFAGELEASFNKLLSGSTFKDDDDEVSSDDTPGDISSIKRRAMRNVVNPIKHLTGVNERKERQQQAKDKGKKNDSSPTKSNKGTSKKRKVTPRKIKPKRRRKSIKSDTDDDSIFSFSSTDLSDVDPDLFANDRGPKPEQPVDIALDSLPVFITTEVGGKVCEIEIIDELENKAEKPKETPTVSNEPEETPTVSNEPKGKVERSLLPEKVKRLERRELKQPVLRSKFKRMGLPIADYKDS